MHKPGARLACTALLLIFAAPGSTQVSSRDRISRPVDAAQTALVKGTAHPLARAQFDQGRTDPSQALHGVSLTFRLSPAQQADLDNLLRQQQDPSSSNYHKWLTPEQYAARFGMTQNDLAKVTSWLQSQGLTVDSISRNRTEVYFSGTVGQIEHVLKTEIHNYSIKGEQHFANATDVSLPAAFSKEVLGVRGLNDFRPKPRVKAAPRFTSSISGNHFLIPGDFAVIYNLPSNLDGTGQTIAVVGQTNISNSDIDAFRSAAGLAPKDPTVLLVPNTGALAFSLGDETEADLDLEWSNGVAPAASVLYYTVGNNPNFNVFDSLHYAIQQDKAPVISISYGNCEANLGQSIVLTMQQWAQQANVQGQTISGPAGDQGAADCESATATTATHGLAVDVPAAIPEVTGVGGTEFTGDASQCPLSNGVPTCPTTPACPNGLAPADPPYWGQACTLNSGTTALQNIPEKSWNDTNGGTLSAGGGGASTIFGKPSWQSGTGVPADGKRDVPDIALNASPAHDSSLICSQAFFNSATPPINLTSCTNGFRASDNKTLEGIGGTSVGAPTFAGILALVNEATHSNGLGNVNPMLYSLAASNPNAFNDIPSGSNNKVPCTSGTTNCPAGTTTIGFSTGTGYDQVTGIGSLNVANLIAAWPASPAADFLMDSLTSRISSPGAQGTSTITITALNGFAQTVNLTCSPSSSTAHISCSLNPTSVDLSSNKTGTSTLSITTVADLQLPRGAHPRGLWFAAGGGTLFAALVLCGVPSRWRRRNVILGLVLFASITTIVGCGGGSGGGGGGGGASGTPPGTYSITVTGTSPAGSHSTTVSVTVL
jgi:subtilase family serine protease